MCSIYLLAHYLHHLLKNVDFPCKRNCQHKLIGYVDRCVFQMFISFLFTTIKIITNDFEPLSLKPMQGNGVLYLTVLMPNVHKTCVKPLPKINFHLCQIGVNPNSTLK